MSCAALVLNASLRQSLVTVRSLGRRGLQVAAAGTSRNLPAFASRWCARRFVFPTDETSDDYFGRVEEWLDESGAETLIASHDGTIELLRQQRARLEPRVRLALAPEPALAVAINKERTEEVARRLGIPVPREVLVREAADLPAALKEIGLPAVIKPCESWLANSHERLRAAPVLVVSAAEAARAVERVTRFGMSVLFQQLLSGRREAVSFLYANGQMYARFAQLAARTHPPLGGASVLRQSIAIPRDTGRYAEALVRDINLEGYSEVEFRRGADGVPYLMEINPRLSASVEVAVRAGVDFPFLLYQWASGSPITQQNGYRIGGWMRYLGGDIETTVDSLQQRGRPGISPPVKTIMDFGVSFLKPMGYDYFDWEDPLPAVRAASGFVRTTFKRLGSHMRRVVLGKAAL